jgi:hypothetical protein
VVAFRDRETLGKRPDEWTVAQLLTHGTSTEGRLAISSVQKASSCVAPLDEVAPPGDAEAMKKAAIPDIVELLLDGTGRRA